MDEGGTEQPKGRTKPDATVAFAGKRIFQTTDEATVKRLEKVAAEFSEDLADGQEQHGVEKPGGVGIMGPDQVKDQTHDDDKDAPVAG
ncbi:MAG: hypothetical protein A2785_02005 [Candidatus Chisholmbacteria bacterium RIFCSPHIGHO2_01_FULL_49_18]|uniref:Uncharacterized protein n=1 Tax=Candidatus Chisholmbacteria bacterium RIFCSPHIGHO2_01_FULL_49_18 TaxID=1797590 RepID=A0A1G1VM38_9BACT|nr:MAG: hypothetical protein A2785_02005 [Candidatus Chisholmbacteria bacterium RIFCSPHIGHO2_01_FULL_49_18]